VFDGHGGKHAADFASYHLPRFIAEDEDFPMEVERVVASAFLQTDSAFEKACSLDAALASGTTALAVLVVGRLAFIHPPTDSALLGAFNAHQTRLWYILLVIDY
jgi:protein phosphatase 2C family protein 2/3